MRTRSMFKPFFPRPLPATSASHFSNLHFAHDFLHILSQNPTTPKTLSALDSMLSQSLHLLDSTTSVLVLRGLSLARKLTRAKSILTNLHSRNTIPHPFLYSLVLQCLVRDGTISDAESVWRDVTVSTDDTMDVSDFVIHLCRCGENASIIEQVYLRVLSSSGRMLSRQAYVALVGAMCNANNPNNPGLARTILNDMVENGYEPDSITYFLLFRCFCRVGNVLEADCLLMEWRKRCNLEFDVTIYGNYFYGLCKSGRFREARKLFDKLLKRDRDCRTGLDSDCLPRSGRRSIFQLAFAGSVSETLAFEAYFRSLCSAGKVEEAETLMKLARKKSIVPEVCVYGSFIRVLCGAGRAGDAMKFFENEKRRGYISSRDIAVYLVFGFCETGKAEEGYKLLREMVSNGFVPTVRVWNRILRSYWKDGNVDKAVNLFQEIKYGCGGGCSAKPDGETYGLMVNGFLEKGEVDEGIKFLQEMAREKFKAGVDLYGAVVRCLHGIGRVEESNEYLNRMIETGVLVSYAAWECLYDSVMVGSSGYDTAELWKRISHKKIDASGKERRRLMKR